MFKRARLALGFTLIEMAIVLVVMGLVIGGGVNVFGPAIESANISQTNQRLDTIEQALILHVIRYGCLPCPANPGDASTAATAGQSTTGSATGTYTGCSSTVCFNAQGIVPWRNLGLSEAEATDGFGSRIDYAIRSNTASPGNLQQTNAMARTLPATYPVGNLTVNEAVASGSAITTAAAYVLVSHGPNRWFGYLASTGSHVAGDGTVTATDPEGLNDGLTTPGGIFSQGDYVPASGSSHFDDIVRWRTAPMIIQLCGSNACGNPA